MNQETDKNRSNTLKYLDELESKALLASVNIPLPKEVVVHDIPEAQKAAQDIGFPIVLKALGIAHKTEANAVITHIYNAERLKDAFLQLKETLKQAKAFLIQEMVMGKRELVVGFERDELMGPCVMFGLGGIFTEVLKDITFRIAPLSTPEARLMLKDIKAKAILGDVRGEPAADLDALAQIIQAVGDLGTRREDIKSIDINPVILCGKRPVAVDALVELYD